MKPIDSTGRALLDAANRERTPDAETRARVLAAVLAVGISTSAVNAKAASASLGHGAAKAGAGFVHWLLLGALGAAALAFAYVWVGRAPPGHEAHSANTARPTSPTESASTSTIPVGVASALESAAAIAPKARVPASSGGATSSSNSTTSALPPPNALDHEISLLQTARAAYRAGQASRALQLAQEHGHLFPRSQLSAERQTIEVLSLCALGRTPEARAIASRLRAASGSPSVAGLDDSCAAL